MNDFGYYLEITIRSPKTFGCTIASGAIVLGLKSEYPGVQITVFTDFPDLFFGMSEIDKIVDLNNSDVVKFDIDLYDYLDECDPQASLPRRHLINHMFEIAERKLGVVLDKDFLPKINLTNDELLWAEREVKRLSPDKPLVWIQTKSRVLTKEVPKAVWDTIVTKGSEKFTFIDLSNQEYSRRESVALTKFAHAGIVLDSFLLHGSFAVGSKNVICILVTSFEEVVCYKGQIPVKFLGDVDAISETILSHLKTFN